MDCTADSENSDIRADMVFVIDKTHGVIQLEKILPLDIVYAHSHGSGSTGGLWLEHHRSFAKFIRKHKVSSVFEIGGGHGILSREASIDNWTILEVNPSPAPGVTAKYIKGYFENSFRTEKDYDALVHSHVFEHIYTPHDFLHACNSNLSIGKYMIFSIPNMEVMLRRKYTNCLNFEHTILITEPFVEWLLTLHGFELVDKEYFREDHSIFYSARKSNTVSPRAIPIGFASLYEKLFMDYIEYHRDLVLQLNTKIVSANKKVFLFGGHVFSQYLFSFGLNQEKIVGLLDNDKNKQGKRLRGTTRIVYSPAILKNEHDAYVILKAGVYNEEIKKDILNNINPRVIFWE